MNESSFERKHNDLVIPRSLYELPKEAIVEETGDYAICRLSSKAFIVAMHHTLAGCPVGYWLKAHRHVAVFEDEIAAVSAAKRESMGQS